MKVTSYLNILSHSILLVLLLVSCENKNKVEDFIKQGNKEFQEDKYADAIKYYTKVLDIDSINEVALNNRAWSNFYLNHIDLSIKDFSTLIQHGVSKDEAYINRSQCYEKLGLFNEELMNLNQAIKINPSNTIALNNRGIFYTTYNQPVLALEDLNKAISLNPKMCEAYLNRGLAYQRLENKEKTLIDFNEANKLCPEDADILHNRGKYYAHIKQQDKALIDLGKAISLNPNDGEIYYSRGIVYLTMKEQTKACEDFYKAEQLGYKKAIKYLEQYCKDNIE